jgi:hypothetical protein
MYLPERRYFVIFDKVKFKAALQRKTRKVDIIYRSLYNRAFPRVTGWLPGGEGGCEQGLGVGWRLVPGPAKWR